MTFSRRALMALTLLLLALAACAPRTEAPTVVIPETPLPPQAPGSQAPGSQTPGAQTPQTPGPTPDLSDPATNAADRTAHEAFRLMKRSFEQSGSYNVGVLASDLELPSGVKWQLEDLSAAGYALRFTSDDVPDLAWLVTPAGVSTESADANRIL